MAAIQPIDEKPFVVSLHHARSGIIAHFRRVADRFRILFFLPQPPATWGAYLYQNFLQSAPDSSLEWSSSVLPSLPPIQAPSSSGGYPFGVSESTSWAASGAGHSPAVTKAEAPSPTESPSFFQQQDSFCQQPAYHYSFPNSTGISTSLLTQPAHSPILSLRSQLDSTESVNLIDHSLTRSPSPLSSHIVSPHASPIRLAPKTRGRKSIASATVKRSRSLHSDSEFSHHSHDEHDHEVPEGVERDGMIWGMRVEDYRALSARERKRVRNRISARTFRAKRKGGLQSLSRHDTPQADRHPNRLEHLSSLEHDLSEKEQQIRVANEENARLRREMIERESLTAVFLCQKSDSQLSKEEIIKNRKRIWPPVIARRHVVLCPGVSFTG